MAMKRCNNGHYYDGSKYSTCPYCNVNSIKLDAVETQAASKLKKEQGEGTIGQDSPLMRRCINGHYYDSAKFSSCPYCWGNDKENNVTMAKKPEHSSKEKESVSRDEGVTIGIIKKSIGVDPVVGWFVCVEGNDKGKDYRIRSERNFIGRSEKMDICISGDNSISRENHAIVSYNPKKSTFKISAGDGRGIVYVNGEDIETAIELKAYDVVEIGQTKLLFVPFCGECFRWE